ncbi:MAG: hypothetical protein PHF00_06375, partial [Elusimicrobia bacterium]|nr:hypothetical protein [Elusimicrobiota bacterium]
HTINGPITISHPQANFLVATTTMVAVGSVTVNSGGLKLQDRALFKASEVWVHDTGGRFEASDPYHMGAPVITAPTGWLSLRLDGAVDISSGVFTRLNGNGLYIGAAADLASLSSFTIASPLQAGATAITFFAGGNYVSTFTNVNFAASELGANIYASLLGGSSRITMRSAKGIRSGPQFTSDSHAPPVIWWPEAGGGGGIDEDFEGTGTLTTRPDHPLPWQTSPDHSWYIQTSTRYAGSQAAAAGYLSENSTQTQISWLEVPIFVIGSGDASFRYKTNPPLYGNLRFYVNGTQRLSISSAVPWSQAVIPVAASNTVVTFRWEYERGSYSSYTANAGIWLDDVSFPPYVLGGGEASGQLYDDFERAYSCSGVQPVGNNWAKLQASGDLCVDAGKLRFNQASGYAYSYVYQSVANGPAYFFQGDLAPGEGCFYSHWLLNRFDGTVGASGPNAQGLRLHGSGCGTSSFAVEAWDKGQTMAYGQSYSSFAFTGALRVGATFYADGSIVGRVLDLQTGKPFDFKFSTRSLSASGDKVGLGMDQVPYSSYGSGYPSIDSATIVGLGAMDNPWLGPNGEDITEPAGGWLTYISSTIISVAWDSTWADGTSYRVQASSTADFPPLNLHSVDTTELQAVFYGLQPDTTYFVRISSTPVGDPWRGLGFFRTERSVSVDFESGFGSLPWGSGGYSAWQLDQYAGRGHPPTTYQSYGVTSGYIAPGAANYLALTLNVTASGQIGFDFKTDTEWNYGFFRFYIDGVQQGQAWTGWNDWNSAVFSVGAGVHTFRWEYSKNIYASANWDRVNIDNLSLPSYSVTSSQGLLHGDFVSADGAFYENGQEAAYAVAVDTVADRVFVVGQSSAESSANLYQYVLFKYDLDGVFLASSTYALGSRSPALAGADQRPHAALVSRHPSASGALFVAGTYDNAGQPGWAVFKFDPNFTSSATAYWSNGAGAEAARGLAIDGDSGDLLVAGNGYYTGVSKSVLRKYQGGDPTLSLGGKEFAIAGGADEQATGIALNQGWGGVFIAGYSGTTGFVAHIDTAPATWPPAAWISSQAFSLGAAAGARRVRVAVDRGGANVYVASDKRNDATGRNEFFVIRYSTNLAVISSATFGRSGFDNIALDVAVATNGAVYVAGVSSQAASAEFLAVRYAYDLALEDWRYSGSGTGRAAAVHKNYAFVAGSRSNPDNLTGDIRTIRLALQGSDGPVSRTYVQAYNLLLSSLPVMGQFPVPALALDLWTADGSANWSSLNVVLNGDVPSTQAMLRLSSSATSAYDPGWDKVISSAQFVSGIPPRAWLNFSGQLLGATTRHYFLSLSYGSLPVGARVQLGVQSAADFGVLPGQTDGAGSPWLSAEARTQFDLWAATGNPAYQWYSQPSSPWTPPQYYYGGGYYSGLYVRTGQQLHVESSGTWSHDGATWHGPNGTAAFSSLTQANDLGALVGRIQGGPWFFLGSSTTRTADRDGALYLAMSDDDYSNAAGSVTVRYYILTSTVARVWAGGAGGAGSGLETKADIPDNWNPRVLPQEGDRVVFDTSAYDCDWTLPGLSLRLLEMTTSYSRTLRLAGVSGTPNYLTVTDGMVIARGTLDLGGGNTLTVPGELLVASSGTLDLGWGASRLRVGTLRLTGDSFLRGQGASPWPFIEAAPPSAQGEKPGRLLIGCATVAVSGLNFSNVAPIDIASGARISRFDQAWIYGYMPNGEPSLVLHSTRPVRLAFDGWRFESWVSSNVNANDVFGGSTVTFTNSDGPKTGSPWEMDYKDVVSWAPDGGKTADLSGSVSGGSFGDFYVLATTDPAGVQTGMSRFDSSAGAYAFSALRAPATWYLFGFRSTSPATVPIPNPADPRGGYGHAGSWLSDAVYLDGVGNVSGMDISLGDWTTASGSVTLQTPQTGALIVQAMRSGAVEAFVRAQDDGTWFLSVPAAASLDFRAFMDVDADGEFDSAFEASGSSTGITEPGTYVNVLVSGGGAPPGGVVAIATQTAHSGSIRWGEDEALLRLRLSDTDAVLGAKLGGLQVAYEGALGPGGVELGVAADDDGDHIYSSADRMLARQWTPQAASPVMLAFPPQEIPAGGSRDFFVTARVYAAGGARVVVASSSSFAMASGSIAPQPIYPLGSDWAQVKKQIPASWPAYGDNTGGACTDVTVYKGQLLSIAAQGVWYSSAGASGCGPGGTPGTGGQNAVVTSTNIGALIARVNSYDGYYEQTGDRAWFAVGLGTAGHVVGNTGNICLAMNDVSGAYYDNSGGVLVEFGVAGSTTGALAGTVYYTGGLTGTLNITANALQTAMNTPIPFREVQRTLSADTTYYPYAITGLPPGWYNVSAAVEDNPAQTGVSGRPQELSLGTTNALDVTVSLGSASLSGRLLYDGVLWDQYAGTLQGGANFRVGVTTSPDLEHDPAFFGWAVQSSSGGYTVAELPVPNTYYVIAFADTDYDQEPGGPEPLGYHGSTVPRQGVSAFAAFMTPVPVAVSMSSASGADIRLLDNGSIEGSAALPAGASGRLVLAALRDGVPENRDYRDVAPYP